MKLKKNTLIETPYVGIDETDYQIEKRRLQVELLKLQQFVVKKGLRLAVVFEGRDAAGKGSTIKRFNENLMPAYLSFDGNGNWVVFDGYKFLESGDFDLSGWPIYAVATINMDEQNTNPE